MQVRRLWARVPGGANEADDLTLPDCSPFDKRADSCRGAVLKMTATRGLEVNRQTPATLFAAEHRPRCHCDGGVLAHHYGSALCYASTAPVVKLSKGLRSIPATRTKGASAQRIEYVG